MVQFSGGKCIHTVTQPISGTLLSLAKLKVYSHSTVTHHFPPPQPLATTFIHCSMNLTTVDTLWKWNHSICLFFFTDWLSTVSSSFLHVTAFDRISFLFKIKCCSTMYRYHLLFIHSSIHSHFGCFCLLALANNAALNTGVQISLQDPAFHFLASVELLGLPSFYNSRYSGCGNGGRLVSQWKLKLHSQQKIHFRASFLCLSVFR